MSSRRLFPALLATLGLAAATVAASEAGRSNIGTGPAVAHGPAKSALAWADLLTSGSPAEIAPFYTRVLGWTSEKTEEGRDAYVRLFNQGRPVAGIAHRPSGSPGMPRTRWLGFLVVPDLADATERATAQGATVLMPVRPAPGGGVQAVLADPEGATFGLLAVAPGENLEICAAPGEWLWPALLADDPFKAADFYGRLLGLQTMDDMRTPMFTGDLLLSGSGHARAGVVALPNRAGKRPGWLWFVRVADLDATVRAVEKEGGRALHQPRIDLLGGRLAVVADPWGAVFGLIETTPAKSSMRVPQTVLRP